MFEVMRYVERGRMAAVVDGRPVVYAAVGPDGLVQALCPACASRTARSRLIDTLSLAGEPLAGLPRCHGCADALLFA